PVNRSKAGVNNYQRDGYMRVDGNAGSAPNYEPNSLNGPKEDESTKISPFEVQGTADSVAYDSEDHYTQPGELYRLMSEDEKTRLVSDFCSDMKHVVKEEIKLRQIAQSDKADAEWGEIIAKGLGLSVP